MHEAARFAQVDAERIARAKARVHTGHYDLKYLIPAQAHKLFKSTHCVVLLDSIF